MALHGDRVLAGADAVLLLTDHDSFDYDAVARHKGGMLSMESFKDVIGQERASAAAKAS